MGSTLKLCDYLLARGRRYREVGRLSDALRVLNRLTALPNLSKDIAEPAHHLLAELRLRRGHYRRARRHLIAALALAPNNGRYHYLLAYANRAEGRTVSADRHYREAVRLDPTQIKYLTRYGLFLVRHDRAAAGLKHLRKAVRLAPHDVAVAGKLLKGLRVAGRLSETREAARAALFANPRSLDFLQLWRECQFRLAARNETTPRTIKMSRVQANPPVILPFDRSRIERPPQAGGKERQDEAVTLPGPHFPRPARRRVQ